jgi:hypothetical protein
MPSAPHGDRSSSKRSTYYWAGGRKVRLLPSNQVAVDLVRAQLSDLEPKQLAEIRRRGRSVNDGLMILGEAQFDEYERAELEAAAALQPIYASSDGTLIIVLPEVRVEISDPDKGRSFLNNFAGSDRGLQLSESKPGRFVIKLGKGNGDDALLLANELVETLHPDLAQARFVRLTDRPGPRGTTRLPTAP